MRPALAPVVALVVVPVVVVPVALAGCAKRPPPPPPAAVVVDAGPAAKKLGVADVLALLTKDAPLGVQISVRDQGGDVAVDLKGAGPPSIALALLSSVPQRLPDVRAENLAFDADAWTASLVLPSSPSSPSSSSPSLVDAVAAAQPVFGGPSPLLRAGAIAASSQRLLFHGALAPGRALADASGDVAPGWRILRVESGADFVLELQRAPR